METENSKNDFPIQDYGKKEKSIKFEKVYYRYPLTNKYVLQNVDVTIKEGQHIAIVGENGSGKSTFVKLILKLLEPSLGEIKCNNFNLKEFGGCEYWKMFSSVFQDYSKFKESLRYNVGISNVSEMANDKKIREALSAVEFNKRIDIDCMLSKEFDGIEPSGGEWQKIALARAIFHSADVLILDEPTSAIDPVKETEIYKHFAEMTEGKTSIFVTHRLGSVLYSDLILFFKDGKIAEAGSHEELLEKQGLYFQFWSAQSSLYNV